MTELLTQIPAATVALLRGIVISWFTTLPGCFLLSFAFSIALHAAVT